MKMDEYVCLGRLLFVGGWKCAEEVFGDLSASYTPSVSMMLELSAGCSDTSQITHWVRSATSMTLRKVSGHAFQMYNNYYQSL